MRKKDHCHGKKLLAGLLAAAMLATTAQIPEAEVQAAEQSGQTLTVDLTDTTGDIVHGASGFLYGISSEEVPTNNTLVPLKPKVLCTKGALGTEHPYGDALDVAKSFLESGGQQVMMYNSNYYGVFGVTANYKDYAEVLKNIIAPAVVEWKEAWKKDHAGDNLGAIDIDQALVYIPINEGTPVGGTDFNRAWEAYYDAIKESDPAAVVAGPNSATYNTQFTSGVNMRSHIQYCANNDCMPDVITWHDLQTDKLQRLAWEMDDFRNIWATTNWTQYKKDHPEKFAGGAAVPEIPQICINEYADFAECGVPGRLVNWIARLEDQKVYGCLPFWHQANNLNDLTADANQGNGAWWLYKWYGDMSGQTVKVETNTSYEKLYGVASVDDTKKISTTLLGGVDGRANVNLLHVNQTNAFRNDDKVHVKVQSTAFSGYHGAKEGTTTILEGTFPVNEDGSVGLILDNMKFSTAYNVTITEAGEGEKVSDPLVNAYQKVYEAEEATLGRKCSIRATEYYNPKYYISADSLVEMPQGAELTYQFEVPVDGKYRLDFIYGNETGSMRNDMERHNPQNIGQAFSIDGGKASELVMENTLLGSMTGIKTLYADFTAGVHNVKIKTNGNGIVGHDSLTVTWYGAKDQAVKILNERYEAEHADFNILLSNSDTKVKTETTLGGYSSNGYVTGLHERSVKQGGGIRFNVVVAESGLYNLAFRYQSAADGSLNLYIGNTAMTLKEPDTRLSLKKTGNAWGESEVSLYLQKGINIVDVDTTKAAFLDYMQVRQVPARNNALHETVIEAEDCIPPGSAIRTAASAGASGGRYVVGMEGSKDAGQDKDKYLEITYNAPSAGIYQMRIYQSNNDICGVHSYNTKIIDKYASVEVNGQKAERYFFMNTFSDDTFKEKTVSVNLKEGANTIRIYNDDSWHVKWGGTTSLPGENELDNYAPNFDKFVLMPFVLEDTILLPEEYQIQLTATGGGYVTVDKNSVKKGGEFQVTAVPGSGSEMKSVLVNGEDVTGKAVKDQDNRSIIKILNVQKDVTVQISFDGTGNENQDRDASLISRKNIYQVDCGDFNPDTLSKGEKFGQYNHVTDQVYQEDIRTGKFWGVVTSQADPEIGNQNSYGGAGAYTKYQWAWESLSGDVAKAESFRYAHNQTEDGISPRYVKYRFQIEPGSYSVVVGMGCNSWDNAHNPDVYIGETGNAQADTKLNAEALNIPKDGNKEVQGTVTVQGQDLYVYALSQDATLQMNYINIAKAKSEEAEQTDNPNLVYFIDCGDFDPETASDEDRIGRYQSVTDRIYGKDEKTGKSWGVVTSDTDRDTGVPTSVTTGSGAAYTTYQWAHEKLTEDVSKTESFRYAHGQDTAGISPRYVKYRMEVEPGEYKVIVGMGNSWNNAADPDVYAGTGNVQTDSKLNQDALHIPENGIKEVQGNVTVSEGQTTLDVYALSQDATLQMNYIYVEKAGKQELKLEKLILTPPAKKIYSQGESLDLSGISVKALYNDGTVIELSKEDYTVEGFDSSRIGEQMLTVIYTNGETVMADFAVCVRNADPTVSEKTYKVTYHDNKGGKVTGMPSDKNYYKAGQKATVKGTPISTAKFFAGWNTKANGKGKSYAAGKKITVNGNVHLYAQWKTSYTAKDKLKYKVNGKKMVSCIGTANKKASAIKIPATVKYNGITYKVTSVGAKAFANNKKIKKVTIGGNVRVIQARAFEKCRNLKNITVGTGLTAIEKYAFSGEKKGCVLVINSKRLRTVKTAINHKTENMVIKVPKSKFKAYVKLLKKRAKSVEIRAK